MSETSCDSLLGGLKTDMLPGADTRRARYDFTGFTRFTSCFRMCTPAGPVVTSHRSHDQHGRNLHSWFLNRLIWAGEGGLHNSNPFQGDRLTNFQLPSTEWKHQWAFEHLHCTCVGVTIKSLVWLTAGPLPNTGGPLLLLAVTNFMVVGVSPMCEMCSRI